MKISTKILVYIAVLTACSVLLRRVITIPLPIGIFNFGGFPVILAGLLLGPLAGALTGAVSDILSCILFPKGPYLPYFTITSMLTGCIAPIFLNAIGFRKSVPFWALFLSVALAQGITKMLLVPLIMQLAFGIPFIISFAKDMIKELVHIPIYAIILRAILLTQKYSYVAPSKRDIEIKQSIQT